MDRLMARYKKQSNGHVKAELEKICANGCSVNQIRLQIRDELSCPHQVSVTRIGPGRFKARVLGPNGRMIETE
jgi:hypothetical protein